MTTTVCTADQMRRAEEAWFAAHPGVDLMAVAARAVADAAVRILEPARQGHRGDQRVVVLVGGGNNGGDGLFAAAHLAEWGWDVQFCPVLGHPHEAGKQAALAAGAREVGPDVVGTERICLVIDAVLGIGGRPGIPERLARLGRLLEDAGVEVLAVDLPSGLSADHGEVTSALRATHTLTFASRKWCHLAHPATTWCGEVEVADIGVEVPQADEVWTTADMAAVWPVPGPTSHKYTRGVVGMDTGSEGYPGAAVMGILGALRCGPGMVRFAGPEGARPHVVSRMPSVVCGQGRVQAWVVGSGWGDHDDNAERLERRLDDGVPVVIDADALALLPRDLPQGCLLTPHAGELARMVGVERGEVEADPRGHCLAAAQRFGATVLLKRSLQWVATPQGRVRLALPGPAWTGQAGSGDVLAGMCGTLVAAGLEADEAALTAASLQALAASRMPGPYSPDQMADSLPGLVAGVLEGSLRQG